MKKIWFLVSLFYHLNLSAQNDRVNDFNNINWLQTFNTISLNKKWSLHLEYQWRRTEGLKNWQQSLLRIGTNYKLNDNVTAHLGYGWIETFSYGDYPIANNGTFPEHRIYEQISFRQPVNKFLFTHRFRIEQRWLGRVKAGTAGNREIEDWFFLHRFRYQFRTQYPLWAKGDKQAYAAAADELFIGAGKNLGTNIFDQNRLFLLAGYRFNKRFALEAGYLNQTLQQGRRINNSTIIQRNNGWVLASYLNL
jgi:opacity protein-like surface antigen